jgi:protein phosphatase
MFGVHNSAMATATLPPDTVELPSPQSRAPLRLVSCAARTDRGEKRPENEDALLVAPPLVAVADGVGGHRAGEYASALAIDVLRHEVDATSEDPEFELRRALDAANGAVRAAAQERSLAGMATTVVAALVTPAGITVAHVGDSRAYLLSGGRLELLTQDHSLVGSLVARGKLEAVAAQRHPMRSVILRAVGLHDAVRPDVSTVAARRGDLLLLCSDGLTDAISPSELERLSAAEREVDHLVEHLAEAARRAGAGDDTTVVAARLG